MKKSFIYLMLTTTILLSACSTDLEVIGDYKETMVVYGLLDQSKDTQYVKINKAFLGEGSALEFAKIKDSTQYVNSLNVKIIRLSDGTEFVLSPNNTVSKNPGTFYGPDQANAIYSFASPSGTLQTNSDYKLVIKNSETGKEITSQTPLVNDFNFTKPNSVSPSFSFVSASNPNLRFFVEWNTAKNARAYQLTVRLNYKDYLDTNIDNVVDDSVTKTLDWVFTTQKSKSLSGGELMGNDFLGQDFIKFIGNQLTDYPTLFKRLAINVDLIVVAAADDLNTFIEVNAPSTGIIQEKPEFTNITNGLGIFSSRYYKAPFGKPLASVTLDTLACGQFTKKLKFLNALKQTDGFGKPITCP